MPDRQQTQAQLKLSASRERMFYAAARRHFKVWRLPAAFKPSSDEAQHPGVPCRTQTGKKHPKLDEYMKEAQLIDVNDKDVDTEKVLQPGDYLVVEWEDPRPDTKILEPHGPAKGRSTPFCYWDGPSLALELYCDSMGIPEAEKKRYRGNWLYIACDTTCCWFFWSMMLHYHATGKCFPPIHPAIENSCESIVGGELKRVLEGLQVLMSSPNPPRGQELCISSEVNAVVGGMDQMQHARSAGDLKKGKIPIDEYQITNFIYAPPWYRAQEDLWGGILEHYIEDNCRASCAPCLWVCKKGGGLVGCLAGASCPLNHKKLETAFAACEKILVDPVEKQRATQKLKADEEMASNQATCFRPGCGTVKTESKFARCSRCKNATYCNADCQKQHWKAHKKNCRAPYDEGIYDEVWSVVLPGDRSKRPYAQLLPSKDFVKAAAALIGIKPPRGEEDADDTPEDNNFEKKSVSELKKYLKEVGGVSDFSGMLEKGDLIAKAKEVAKQSGKKGGGGRGGGQIGLLPVMRGDNFLGTFIVAQKPCDLSQPPNLRASAMVTKPDGAMNSISVTGPDVKVRGDAVLIKCRLKSDSQDKKYDFNSYNFDDQAMDVGYKHFDMTWGLFQCIGAEGMGEMATCLMPNTPESEAALTSIMRNSGFGGAEMRAMHPQLSRRR